MNITPRPLKPSGRLPFAAPQALPPPGTDGSLPELPEFGEAWEPFLKQHPRFKQLLKTHGLHAAQLPRAEGSKTMAMQLATLNIRSVAGDSVDRPAQSRKLPTSLVVSKLKLVCLQIFKLDPSRQRLFYQAPSEGDSKAEPSFMEELEDDMRQLAFYGVADGGTIVMDEWAPNRQG